MRPLSRGKVSACLEFVYQRSPGRGSNAPDRQICYANGQEINRVELSHRRRACGASTENITVPRAQGTW
jgi:hypothetical protein